jgi:2-polyprenyl-3-methyl-5-hydroxy-6-metoxy-1,4-benzoquinol methylase
MKEDIIARHCGWEYAKRGDYHRNLDPNWSYTPTYLCKMAFVRKEIQALSAGAHILDAGCGEGVLVQEFQKLGFKIEGFDLNYESKFVKRGSVLNMPYQDGEFDAVLLLDVFEHLAFADQAKALAEIGRVLRKDGRLIASIPNLAHWNSRFRFSLCGKLDRTDDEINHIGERPFHENKRLLEQAGFEITHVRGITLTVPLLYGRICNHAAKLRWLHDLMEPLAIPSLSMLNVFVCNKK